MPTMPRRDRPRYGHRETIDHQSETVRRILDAAATLFAEHCYEGTRIDDIAARAGVNKATIYYHIGGKERVYQVVLLRHFTELADRMEERMAGCEDPLEGLRLVVRLHAEAFMADNRLPRTVAHEMAGGSRRITPEIVAAYGRIHAITARHLRAGVAAGRLRDVKPGALQVLLAGSLLVSTINAPFREQLSSVLMPGEMASLEEMAALLEDILARYLVRA
ncbi:Biofilm operon icaADBC HTH-type negative transcriptional regulator IcaR [Fundidesulfovibrio magnetotacticus]|uniref:Biofilm operon icaADBC HTH-type negative transcriptional regulator IcaR n=1 Tax=Fundidesulfovibrio magnetotacticus TaxID=2730080 RepID=A0A6V8LWZ0_9BACT|nr:TetR/AcrR family transcriptional regulator [Fundidesulfovibrio magnetotacticus]GFK94599.1 Biofilm operon icaADBC HTH-type negative transcriptional regulator IcaR [Fundidesulfovibrio magnetotacticus]